MPTLSTGWTAGSGQERAADINAAFADPDVSVVLAAIGGNHSAQLLPYLDFELIAANPKVFQGYSDNTLLHWAFLTASPTADVPRADAPIGVGRVPRGSSIYGGVDDESLVPRLGAVRTGR